MYTKLPYFAVHNLVSAISGTATYIYRGNDIFDPNFTGVGGQPTGMDQLALLYSRFRVRGSRMTVVATNNSLVPMVVTLVPTSSSGATTTDVAATLPYAKTVTLVANTGGASTKILSSYISTKKVFGLRRLGDETDYTSGFAASPAFVWFWRINASSADGSTSHDIVFSVKITYYVELWNRVQLAAS